MKTKAKISEKEFSKIKGRTYKNSPLSRAEVSDVKGLKTKGDYGKRQSKNIEDVRDRKSKAFLAADKKGKLDNAVFEGSNVTESRSISKADSQNTKNSNIFVQNMRYKHPDLVGSRLKNVKLDSKPTKFKKKK